MDAHFALEEKVMERTRELRREINSRKLNEEKLQISEQRYRTLFDCSGDSIFIVSALGRFLEVNQELCRYLRYSYAELMEITPQDINSPVSGELVARCFQDLFARRKETVVLEAQHIDRDGKIIPVELRAKKIIFNNEDAVLTVCRDIRARKNAKEEKKTLEEKLHRSQKMEAIGLMAGGVAHDLNNILGGVIAYPDMLLCQLPKNHDFCEPLEIVKQSGQRAVAVVADLLTVARGVAHPKETADLNILVRQYFCSPEQQALALQNPEVTYADRELAPDLMNIECSEVHVNKCLMNLVVNATEAIHGKGMVTVLTRNVAVNAENGQNLQLLPGQYVVLVVSDTGIGIQHIHRKQIFEPFYTKKKMGRSGTGLGLAIVWITMQDHKGTVTVESGSKGSSFTLYFPASTGLVSNSISKSRCEREGKRAATRQYK
jgi:PAS domain S-box-containing protein